MGYPDFNIHPCQVKSQLQLLVDVIHSVTECELISLIGKTYSHTTIESILPIEQVSCKYISHYFLIVVIPDSDPSPHMKVQDKIESRLQQMVPATAIVMDNRQFINWQRAGHPFAKQFNTNSVLLFGQYPMASEQEFGIKEESFAKEAEKLYTQGLNKSLEFLAGAELFRIRKQNKLAAFMLHQSLEHLLRSMFRIGTGINMNTHSLDKLTRCCSLFNGQIMNLFPRDSEKNEKLFSLFQRAYVDSRYNDDYFISACDLEVLTSRIKAMQGVYQEGLKLVLSVQIQYFDTGLDLLSNKQL